VNKVAEKMQQRAANPQEYEAQAKARYAEREAALRRLSGNKDFLHYQQIEAEMHDPRIVIAHKCSDPTCESLKQMIRNYWKLNRAMDKVQERPANGQSHP
jgi:hypothetical protein